jgi:hypothetical protein
MEEWKNGLNPRQFEPNVLSQKLLYGERHSGLVPESSLFNWIPAFAGMTPLIIIVKK